MMKKGEKGDEVDEEEWGENKKKESIGRGKKQEKKRKSYTCLYVHTHKYGTHTKRIVIKTTTHFT